MPDQRLSDRLRERVEAYRSSVTARRFADGVDGAAVAAGERSGSGPDTSVIGAGSERDGSFVTVALVAIGAAMLALGLLWAWQTWSQRAQQPIDDLIPLYSSGDGAPAPDEGDSSVAGADAVVPSTVPETSVLSAPLAATAESVAPSALATSTATPAPDIIVHVAGAVVRPGVVELDPGARIFQAIDAAGGARADADLERVNLAAPLVDGARIHVPTVGQEALPSLVQPERPAAAPSMPTGTDVGPEPTPKIAIIDINQAGSVDFMTLPGIGPSIAAAITRTRAERGPFLSVDELLEVPGIGDAKLAQIRPFVVAS